MDAPAEQEHDPLIDQHDRPDAQVKKDRKYSPIYGFVVVPAFLALRIKEFTESGLFHTGELIELISLSILYIPCIVFTFWYPIRNGVLRKEPVHSTLASFVLRLLTSLLPVLFLFYELQFILPCLSDSHDGYSEKDKCSVVTIAERILEFFFFVGLATFVFFNKHYPRENQLHLFLLSHLCSAAIYAYILTVIMEETHIYGEILERLKPNSSTEVYTIHRRYRNGEKEDCKGGLACLLRDYLEMFYVATSEFLVVAISVIIGIIFQVGNGNARGAERRYPYRRMLVWTGIVIVAVAFQVFLIFLNVQKADTESRLTKWIFTAIHVGVLTVGTITCVILYRNGDRGHHNGARDASELLDRYLLYFGTSGMLFYTMAGIVHSSYLIPTEYSTEYAVGSLLVNVFSLFQVLAQTATVLHRDMIDNDCGYWAGITLWVVNFIMFCLDLFDAATLGIYSNPVPKDSSIVNVAWTMFVRGLGPFDVFYRFHSLAVIAENIEHHIRERDGLHRQRRHLILAVEDHAD